MQGRQYAIRPGLTLLLLISVILTLTPRSNAEEELVKFEEWADLATIYKFSDSFRYDGDYGIRGVLSSPSWQIYLRPSVRYQVRPILTLHGGVGWFHTFFSDSENINELRPWLGLRAPLPVPKGFVLSNYLRMELRAFHLPDEQTWDIGWRGRYQLHLRSPDFRISALEGLYALASVEFFTNLGSAFVDRIRVNFGAGKRVTQALRMELSYLHHQTRAGDQYTFEIAEHMIRLRLFYNLN